MDRVFGSGALEGRVCVVTGGGTGIGRAIALGLARCGARLWLVARRVERCAQVAEECRALGAEAHAGEMDVREADSIERAFDALDRVYGGRVDVLVNNAGANFAAPALAITPNGWRAVTQTVLDGTFFCSQAAARRMVEHGGGSIVNNASTNGWNASPLMAHSGAAKAGVISLTETLAAEWGPFGIRVNAIAPGAVDTDGANERLWSEDDTRRRMASRVPLGQRLAVADDCVGAVLFLASDAARFITGAVLAIDGGQRLRSVAELG